MCGYIFQCMFAFAAANKLLFFFSFSSDLLLFLCNLQTYIVTLIIVRTVYDLCEKI